MSSKVPTPAGQSNRRWLVAGAALLLVVLALIVFNSGNRETNSDSPMVETGNKPEDPERRGARIDDRPTDGAEPVRSRSSNIRSEETEDEVPGMFPLVERILDDESISESGAAASFAEIAMRSDISLEERYEALAHGLNLDFPSFVDIPSDPALPVEMAQLYLDELLNYNQNPVIQIEGCVALLKHSDKEIQVQAREQLAFLVQDESLVDFPERLPAAAAERIKHLKEFPPEPLLTDESADKIGLE